MRMKMIPLMLLSILVGCDQVSTAPGSRQSDGGAIIGDGDAAMMMDGGVDADMPDAMVTADAGQDSGIDGGSDASVPPCVVGMDSVPEDLTQPVETFVISYVAVPSGTSVSHIEGLDVDNLTTVDSTTASGCFVPDAYETVAAVPPKNIDNQFGNFAEALRTLGFDFDVALQSAGISVSVQLSNWNHTPNDSCVTVGITVGTSPTVQRATTLTNGVSEPLKNLGAVDLQLPFAPIAGCQANPSVLCNNGQTRDCSAILPFHLEQIQARLNIQPRTGGGYQLATGSQVTSPTMVGGFLYWGQKLNNASLTPASFSEDLNNLLCEMGQSLQWPPVFDIGSSKTDLHANDSDLTAPLTDCTGTGPNNNNNANAMSFGFYLGSN